MDKESLFDNFFDTAPAIAGHKPAYTVAYMAILRATRKRNSSTLIDASEEIIEYAGIGRTLYFESIKWLQENGFIDYVSTKNGKLPAKISLNLEFRIRTASGFQADSKRIPSEQQADSKPSPAREVEYINNNTSPSVASGAPVRGEERAKSKTLREHLSIFSQENPLRYPSLFYDDFLRWWDQPSERTAGRQRWHTKVGSHGEFNLKGLLEESWARFGQEKYPNWVVDEGYPNRPIQPLSPVASSSWTPNHAVKILT